MYIRLARISAFTLVFGFLPSHFLPAGFLVGYSRGGYITVSRACLNPMFYGLYR